MTVTRRGLMVGMAAATVLALSACSSADSPWDPLVGDRTARPRPHPSTTPDARAVAHTPVPSAAPTPTAPPVSVRPDIVAVPAPGGTITALPGQGNLLAWTVDDGLDSATVRAYADFVRDSGIRLTFFVTSGYPSWTENAALIRPLVESGQVQLGNHTTTHPALTKISDKAVVDELTTCDRFIRNTYGADATPFYRPPFGYVDQRVRNLAASIGYRTTTLWYGTLSDSGRITPEQVVDFANQWFLPQHIVIGHANFDPVTQIYGRLLDLIRQRSLQTVTLADVWSR